MYYENDVDGGISSGKKCKAATAFLYQGACVPKACLNNKLSRVRLVPNDDYTTN